MIWLFAFAAAWLGAFLLVCRQNARVNGRLDQDPRFSTKNRIIHHQNSKAGAMYRFGLYHASFNACEVIAVHNVKVLQGRESSFSATAADFQRAGAMVGLGIFGSNPYLVGRVLKRSGIPYCRLGRGELRGPGIYIVSFWNEGAPWKGIHTVAAEYDGKTFRFYNNGSWSRKEAAGSLFYEKNFICAYFL